MKCRHCHVVFHDQVTENHIGFDADGYHLVLQQQCPSCERFNIVHAFGQQITQTGGLGSTVSIQRPPRHECFVHPQGGGTRPLPPQEVPKGIRQDYVEASNTLTVSPKASAALGRRCLQDAIRTKLNIKLATLDKEIDEVIGGNHLPSEIAEQLDYLRQIGNFAAHTQRSVHTGEIIDVEPGEAEWTLEVLDLLFDYWWVGPAKAAAKKAAFNKKLGEAGKPQLP